MKALVLLALSISAFAQSPKVYVMWATHPTAGFVAVDWTTSPTKIDPFLNQASPVDSKPGWVTAIKIGEHVIFGCDHYAVQGTKTWCWRESSDYANAHGGRAYGRQAMGIICSHGASVSCDYYGAPQSTRLVQDFPTEDHPWSEFVKPPSAITKHGKTVNPMDWDASKKLMGDVKW